MKQSLHVHPSISTIGRSHWLLWLLLILPWLAQAQCPRGTITLATQASVDAFSPGCTNVINTLIISGADITNLNGLKNLQSVGSDLVIESNPKLTSIAALTALTSVSANLQIANNELLPTLDGLTKLQSVGGSLIIESNPRLTSIAALTALTNVSTNLQIRNNTQLAVCTINCQLLANTPASRTYISGNGTGCGLSLQQAQDNCSPLAITTQPPSASTVCVGTAVTASVSTTGNVGTYQWYQNNKALTSQTSATLTLPSTTTADAGSYVVVVSNSVTSLTSTAFSLTVTPQSPDYQPLVDLYNSTNGPGWAHRDNWLTGCTPCNWYGVTCDNNGRVTSLELQNNQLSGSIPASLSALTSLQYLYLSANQLSGSIPASLSALTNLRYLYLSANQLSGSIPASLSVLTNLQYLILNNNQLSGSIPASLSALTNLRLLYLQNNQLSGCFPASLSALCGKSVAFYMNPGLPGGGDFAAFCASGAGSDAFMPLAMASPNPVCAGNPVSLSVTAGTAYQWIGPAGFTATTQTPTLTTTTPASSGVYSVTVGNGSPSCTATTSVSLTVNPTPQLYSVTGGGAYCQGSSGVVVGLSGSQTGINYQLRRDGNAVGNPITGTGNSFSFGNQTTAGTYTVLATDPMTSCQQPMSGSVVVTVTPLPTAPILVTASGYPYPAGQSSLTISQNVGPVSLTVLGCSGGMLMGNGNAASSFTVTTANTGTQTYTATCTLNGCTSPAGSFQLTVLPTTLSVLHRDADYGNTQNNVIKPYLELSNAGGQAIPYSEVTVRYWFTSEGQAPPTNLTVYYAQLGSVNMKYVALAQPRQGAFGYVEYRFSGGGSLAGGGNSGPIENAIQKTDGSAFNESDDYSYAANYEDYVPNSHITAYRNGADGVPIIVYGQEPTTVASQTAVQVYSAAKDSPTTSQIQPRLELRNTGNVALPVEDLKLRYYFTSDNNQSASVYVDYADIGAQNVAARVVKLPAPVNGADSYVELSFPGTPMLVNALSSLGVIDFRIVRSDYGLFDQTNDYSYAPNYGNVGLNSRVTAYLNNTLLFGTPPSGVAARLAASEPVSALVVRVLGNPVVGSSAQVEISGAQGQPVHLRLVDLQGRPIHEQRIEPAGPTEQVSLPLGTSRGTLLLKVSTNSQQQSVKLLRP